MTEKAKIVLASGNAGKVREFSTLLADLGWNVVPQNEFNVVEAEETGLSFVENAILKARNAAEQTGLPAFADDSGIVVDALQGQPGIYSARFDGKHGDNAANNVKLLSEMQGVPVEKRTARFRCCIVFVRDAADPVPVIAEASWEGAILEAASGTEGFGYDPLFYVPTHDCSAAELDSAEKNRISHRGQALQILIGLLAGCVNQEKG
ncbi:MAG: Nucleoside 5-triphosphatase RdgB (dHAPTP, dITP, XTP-specific) (EC [uncultured Thiotrichaceae bacterium]|uniref:dITP/XTP pyrophosphatase n=1 Tax=uncultured Thiotrichaceae bacterium TaxID=298394 RepID=A0A6S6SYB8_9GAMM|nr:MAG: Nucleoside 5-triphosphatase RdgB (dHAPTP, dITP, XTP-specific) (EC [uncultured Thiotrichaceae bacterium]